MAHLAPRVTFNCDNCGNERTQKHSEYKRHKHHFCSRRCGALHRAKSRKHKFSSPPNTPITQKELKTLFKYDAETGYFRVINKYTTLYDAGESPRSVNKDGYLQLRVNGVNHVQHRLAWLYVYGKYPELDLDHINHNRRDNRIANLRQVTKAENNRNMGRKGNNTSGVMGVWWHEQSKKWCAETRHNGTRYRLGSFGSIDEAAEAVKQKRKELGFHDNHGK